MNTKRWVVWFAVAVLVGLQAGCHNKHKDDDDDDDKDEAQGKSSQVEKNEKGEKAEKAEKGQKAEPGGEWTHGGTGDSNNTQRGGDWRIEFHPDPKNLVTSGKNPYFPLEPGYVLHLAGGGTELRFTVTNDTKTIDGVECRVIEEYETEKGQLTEISRNYYALDKTTGDLYYFGEDVDEYKNGKVVGHSSAWHSGEKGAKFGLFVPGKPVVGDKFYQENAPGEAMDRFEILDTNATLKTPAGTYERCVKVRETTPLEPDVGEKVYAPGVGMIKDDAMVLTKVGK